MTAGRAAHDSPRIGILVPTFNSSGTVREALASIDQQGSLRRVCGLWLADDGSDDDTVEQARACWQGDGLALSVLRQRRNRGQWPNVNSALARLEPYADWILVVHGDDVVRAGWLETIMARIRECPAEVASICTAYDLWFPDSSRVRMGEAGSAGHSRVVHGDRDSARQTLRDGCWWHISGSALRLSAFRAIGPFRQELVYASDWEWLVRCLLKGFAVERLSERLLLYRQHADSVSSAAFRTARDIEEGLAVLDLHGGLLGGAELRTLIAQRLRLALRRSAARAARGRLSEALVAARLGARAARAWLASGR